MIVNLSHTKYQDIKDDLVNYLISIPNGPWKQFDFVPDSNISFVLDIAIWIFEYYGWYINVSVNEAFIDSAQLRKNILSIAKQLGYLPFRQNPATISGTLQFSPAQWARYLNNNVQIITIPPGTPFKDEKGLDWQTPSTYQLDYDSLANTWQIPIQLFQGVYKRVEGIIDYTLNPDRFSVKIFDSNVANYSRFNDFIRVQIETTQIVNGNRVFQKFIEDSLFQISGPNDFTYFVNEFEDFIEISFGNGIFGVKPTSGLKYIIEYFTTSGIAGNGSKVFNFTGEIDFITKPNLKVIGNQITFLLNNDINGNPIFASGGSAVEDNESIRNNAPKFYTTRGRAVTTNDWETLIRSRGLNTWDISVWGGKYNIPFQPNVFASAYFIENNNILNPNNFDNNENFVFWTPDIIQELNNFLVKYSSDQSGVVYVNPLFIFNQFTLSGIIQDPNVTKDLKIDIALTIEEYFYGTQQIVNGQQTFQRQTGVQKYNTFFSFSRIVQNLDLIDGLIDVTVDWKTYFRIFDWMYRYIPLLLKSNTIPPEFDFDYWIVLPEINLDSLSWTDILSNQAFRSDINGQILYYTAVSGNGVPQGTPEVVGQIDAATVRTINMSVVKFHFNQVLDNRSFPINLREVRFYFTPKLKKWQNQFELVPYLNLNDLIFTI